MATLPTTDLNMAATLGSQFSAGVPQNGFPNKGDPPPFFFFAMISKVSAAVPLRSSRIFFPHSHFQTIFVLDLKKNSVAFREEQLEILSINLCMW